MANVFLVPGWFYGYDILLEFIFAIVTLVVSYFSYKIYRLTDENKLKLFSLAFLFFSISYTIQSLLNLKILGQISNRAISMFELMSINSFNALGIFAQIIFFTVGLITLLYMALDLDNKRVYFLLLLITLPILFFSSNSLFLFYLLASIMLAFVAIFYFQNYIEKKSIKSLWVFIAFDFIFLGQIHFLFSLNHALYYVLGHFLEFAAYVILLVNLLSISKNGKKKRETSNYS